MKTGVLFGLIAALVLLVGQASAAPPVPEFSFQFVTGPSEGNHELDCKVIRPWSAESGPDNREYPVIAWANGWQPAAELPGSLPTIDGYEPGLIEWALDGPYIVIAANAWSAQESDVLKCLQWLVDQNDPNTAEGSEYLGVVNTEKIGLAGHSQGGGAVIKAGDGGAKGFDFNFDITATIPMNPFGPDWVDPGNQDGPMMLLGGTDDTTTPVSGLVWSFEAVWDAIQVNDQGGLLAVKDGGTHNSEAWGTEIVDGEEKTLTTEEASKVDFGEYQKVTELWWQFHLNGNARSGRQLKRLLDREPWTKFPEFTEVGTLFTEGFDLQ
ncbi:MAG: alpha/beta hydrolase family protein [Dehalococcoidia bacterium]